MNLQTTVQSPSSTTIHFKNNRIKAFLAPKYLKDLLIKWYKSQQNINRMKKSVKSNHDNFGENFSYLRMWASSK